MTGTPAETLTAAADRIRDLAGLALAPPWSPSGRSVMRGANEDHEVALTPTTTTAQWIAAMSPAVADPLVLALRLAAHEARAMQEDGRHLNPDWAMLRLARAILGSGVDTQ